MPAILLRLEPRAIEQTWPRIEGLIGAACTRSGGRYTAPDVKWLAQNGDWQIWIALDQQGTILAVGGTEIVRYPRLLAIAIRFGIGRDRKSWQHFRDDMKAWGKTRGCSRIEGTVRKGWRRIFTGWRHTHDFIEQEIL